MRGGRRSRFACNTWFQQHILSASFLLFRSPYAPGNAGQRNIYRPPPHIFIPPPPRYTGLRGAPAQGITHSPQHQAPSALPCPQTEQHSPHSRSSPHSRLRLHFPATPTAAVFPTPDGASNVSESTTGQAALSPRRARWARHSMQHVALAFARTLPKIARPREIRCRTVRRRSVR